MYGYMKYLKLKRNATIEAYDNRLDDNLRKPDGVNGVDHMLQQEFPFEPDLATEMDFKKIDDNLISGFRGNSKV